ncbi:taste receptor type 2 member 19-like [Lepus europaeus]|uniref:taste receptor type 2 member 19-like n=1 Tax=Lepus europaeus TaxID=9983 RepID=UPI002B4AA76B|nr:taste receptor type 2 member 19-like [Lepus europaeus]
MANLLVSIVYIVLLAEFILGNFANIFIALVNCIDWMRRHKISSADRILIAMAVSRIALLWIMYMHWDSHVFNADLYTRQVRFIILITLTVINHISFWLSTSLSVFYLLKIANFSNPIYILLKRNTTRFILVILLGSLLVLFCHLAVTSIEWTMGLSEHERNMTWKANLTIILSLSYVTVFTGVNFIPFITSLICCLLLIYSLCKHLRKMQLHGQGSQDIHITVHVKAIRTVFSFLLLFAIYFLSIVIRVWMFNRLQSKWFLSLCHAIGLIYPSSHSFVMILENRKLKQAFLSITISPEGLLNEPVFWLRHPFECAYPSSYLFILIWGNRKLKWVFLFILLQMRYRRITPHSCEESDALSSSQMCPEVHEGASTVSNDSSTCGFPFKSKWKDELGQARHRPREQEMHMTHKAPSCATADPPIVTCFMTSAQEVHMGMWVNGLHLPSFCSERRFSTAGEGLI